MEIITSQRISRTLEVVVRMLVEGDYSGLEKLSKGIRLESKHIELGVVEYGKKLINPPMDAFQNVDAIPISNSMPAKYLVSFRLYTHEEGISDLEIQLTMIDQNAELMKVEIDNILVP